MKKSAFVFIAIFCLLISVSCSTVVTTATLTGEWKSRISEDIVETYYFTSDGKYVREVSYSGIKDVHCEFGDYSLTDAILQTDDQWFSYKFYSSKEMKLNNRTYVKVNSRANNNSSLIQGVWANDNERIGFTREGFAIAMGYYYNYGSYEINDSILKAKERPSEYIIVNDNLYIRNFGFIGEKEGVQKYTRITAGGIDTSADALISTNNIIFTNDGQTGSYINCYRTGIIVISDFLDLKVIYSVKAFFDYQNHVISTSNDRHFAFACIDGEFIGYSYER